jgi:polyphenol oxidase
LLVACILNDYELSKNKIGSFTSQSGVHCSYAMFARHGGVSRGPYASLNIGVHVGDQPEAVATNRKLVRDALGVPSLLSARQVHGPEVYCLTEPLQKDREVGDFDALVTDQQDVGLMIQQADCQAVLLFDPRQEVIAAVHCGWRGSVSQIVPRVVEVMAINYGTAAADLQAVISPSLGPCCAEFVNFRTELPADFKEFMVRDNYFDFWRITRSQLIAAGVAETHIQTAGNCTCCSNDFFSYRRAARQDGGLTGRNCSVIALVKKCI